MSRIDELIKLYKEYQETKDELLKARIISYYFRARKTHINVFRRIASSLKSHGIASVYAWDNTYNVPVVLIKLSSFIQFIQKEIDKSAPKLLKTSYLETFEVLVEPININEYVCKVLERTVDALGQRNIESYIKGCKLYIKCESIVKLIKSGLSEDIRDIIELTYDNELDALLVHTTLDELLYEIYINIVM